MRAPYVFLDTRRNPVAISLAVNLKISKKNSAKWIFCERDLLYTSHSSKELTVSRYHWGSEWSRYTITGGVAPANNRFWWFELIFYEFRWKYLYALINWWDVIQHFFKKLQKSNSFPYYLNGLIFYSLCSKHALCLLFNNLLVFQIYIFCWICILSFISSCNGFTSHIFCINSISSKLLIQFLIYCLWTLRKIVFHCLQN